MWSARERGCVVVIQVSVMIEESVRGEWLTYKPTWYVAPGRAIPITPKAAINEPRQQAIKAWFQACHTSAKLQSMGGEKVPIPSQPSSQQHSILWHQTPLRTRRGGGCTYIAWLALILKIWGSIMAWEVGYQVHVRSSGYVGSRSLFDHRPLPSDGWFLGAGSVSMHCIKRRSAIVAG